MRVLEDCTGDASHTWFLPVSPKPLSFISSQRQGRHEVTAILWRWKHTDSVLAHLTGTETEYLLTQSMSVATVSLLTFLAERSYAEQVVGCVEGRAGQPLSHNRLKNVSLTSWTHTGCRCANMTSDLKQFDKTWQKCLWSYFEICNG